MRYVIIGMSAAAVSAARAIRSVDRDGELILVSDEPHPPYSRIFITHYLAGAVTLDDMLIAGSSLDRELGARFLCGRRVLKVDPGSRSVHLASGEALVYDRLLVASGARPQIPEFPGAHLDGVSGMRTLGDAEVLAARVDAAGPGARVVVLGGGLVSMKTAEALVKRGAEVTVVVASRQVLSQMIDRAAAGMIQERMARAGVEVVLGDDVAEARGGPETGVEVVALASGRSLACCALVVGKGVVPNTDFLEGSGVEIDHGVLVDGRGRTSVPGIWAAGDVAEGSDLLTGRRAVLAMWPSAVRQGRAAGLDMAGATAACDGGVRVNAGSFFGLGVASAGLTRAPEGAEEIVLGPRGDFYRKVIIIGGAVAGVVLAGDVSSAGVWQNLIARRVPVTAFAAKLRDRTFGYPAVVPLRPELHRRS